VLAFVFSATYAYDASFRVDWVEDGADKRTTYAYYGDTADNPGKLN
jgi:hypothetical protein